MRSILLLLFLPLSNLTAQYWQQDVHYTIDASLNPGTNVIAGSEKLLYRNNSPDTLHEAYFRLYWNLFTAGSRGEKFAESQKSYSRITDGGITVNTFSIQEDSGGASGYSIDNTIMRVDLRKPIPPGGERTFTFGFEEHVPEGGYRTGHRGRDYNIAQWYPQISTYDKHGWDKSQYLGPAEFHDEYGSFDVTVTIPRSFTLGYTGTLTNPESVYPDSVRRHLAEAEGDPATTRIADYSNANWSDADTLPLTWKFHADSVRDFAWSANEHYIWDAIPASPGEGLRPVTVHALYFTDKAEFWKEACVFGRHAISFFSRKYGPYAYPNMFMVEGVEWGGMEYPGIIFNGHLGNKNNHELFGVLTHEVGHSWYPMMLGSDETYYAFMDEGFNVFITTTAVEDYYGRHDNEYEWTEWYQKLLRYPNGSERESNQWSSLNLAKTGYEEPIATNTYRFQEQSIAGTSFYPKTAAVMLMLQYVLGDSVFDRVMKEYYRRWKFRHPYPEDFYQTAEEVSGQRDLRWFFDEWFNRAWTCDYSVCGLGYDPVRLGDRTVYRTRFRVSRHRPAIMPVDVRIDMADGSAATVWFPIDQWLNGETEQDTTIDLPGPPVRAELNPDGRILDINRLNNVTGIPKIDFRLDNTLFNVVPVDAYLLRARPSLWYTDEGGWKAGYRFTGSYLSDLYATSLSNWFNARDRTLNYDIGVSHNLYELTPLAGASARWYRIEGRKGVTLSFQKEIRRHYSYPPFHKLEFSVSYSQADNPEYLLHPETWQEGILNRMTAQYTYNNRGRIWNVAATALLESSTPLFGWTDFQYSKRTFTARLTLNLPADMRLGLRLIDGAGSGDVPVQTKYYFSGSAPIDQIDEPFFRSKGMLPSTVRDHALAAGGGWMRGYYSLPIAGDKMEAANAEIHFSTLLPFLNPPDLPVLGYLNRVFRTSFFADAGRIAVQPQNLWDQKFEADCGVGVGLTGLSPIFGQFSQSTLFSTVGLSTLRVDFPFYVTRPLADENRLKFRWVISMKEIL